MNRKGYLCSAVRGGCVAIENRESAVGEKNLEDFGYTMERIILFATDLGLGTCWLGGSFTKSRFAEKISANGSERVPAEAPQERRRAGVRPT